jgi:hypothetical protein
MDYKGYNIAIHELGHNVEQTVTMNDVDYYMLQGVPNTAFTEAVAFLFQKRDLELLGMPNADPNKEHMMALDIFWGSYEIMGVCPCGYESVEMDVCQSECDPGSA